MVSKSNYSGSLVAVLVAAATILSGCTKNVPVGPVYTGEDNWTPTFDIYYNNYQRIFGTVETAPRLSLLRNISSCSVQVRLSTSETFETVLSLPTKPGLFQTQAVLKMGGTYKVRLVTTYRDGVVRISPDTTIVSPVVHGKILKSISLTQNDIPSHLWFRNGKIVYDFDKSGWRTLGTSTGSASFVQAPAPLPNSSRFMVSSPVALSGDTAYYEPYNYNAGLGFRLLRYSLVTGQVDSSLTLECGPGNLGGMLSNGKRIAIWWDVSYGSSPTVIEYDAVTGKVLDSCRVSLAPPLLWVSGSGYRDDTLWVNCTGSSGHNKIGRIDFSTGQVVDMYDNPEFSSSGLVWDGANFWVLSYEGIAASSYDKLLLEKE